MAQVAGLTTASTADSAGASVAALMDQADGLILHELGVAIVSAGEEQTNRLAAAAADTGPIATVEAERIVHAITARGPVSDAASDAG